MSGGGWERLFVRDGRVRGLWRILLFAALFLVLGTVGAVILMVLPVPRGTGLFGQGILGTAAALGAGWILLARLDGRHPGALGFARTGRTAREIAGGLAIGAAPLALVVAAMALLGWVRYQPDEGTVGLFVAVLVGDLTLFAVAAAAEEAVFRGYPFQVLVQSIGPVAATILASAAFSIAHLGNPNVGAFALINIFLAGVLLSVAYLRTRSLWFATAIHTGWNWAMASVLDLPVSGLAHFDTPLYEPVLAGPVWATGGAFGPEGGFGSVIALAIALWATLGIPGFEQSNRMKELRPLVDERLKT